MKTIKIEYDNDSESPFEWGQYSFLSFHNNMRNINNESTEQIDIEDLGIKEVFKKINKDNIFIPMYLFDHSGWTVSSAPFSCSWDSGMAGLLYISKERIRKEFSWKKITTKRKNEIKKYLEGFIETLDSFYTSSVYSYRIINEYDDVIDSCYGYYDREHCIEDAKHTLKENEEYILNDETT